MPWYGLVFYTWAITATWRGQCDMSIRFTISKVTVRYQYMCALCYCKIHLISFISCYFSLWSTTIQSIYCVILLIIANLYLFHKFGINYLVIFYNTFFAEDKYIYDLPKSSITNTKQTLKDWNILRVGRSLLWRSWLWFKLSGFSYS